MRVRCPYCGAEYEAPDGVKYASCPYCGTVVEEGKTFQSVYIFAPLIDKEGAFRRALTLRPWASPRDLADSASPGSAELHFLPLYLYYVYFEPLVELATYATALALRQTPFYVPRDYKFPARWRTPFKPGLLNGARFHTPQMNPDEAWAFVSREYAEEAGRYASALKVNVRDATRFEGVVYYPFWKLSYRYKGRSYSAVVDAAEGDVVYMEYPVPARGRLYSLGLGAFIMAVSAALGAALGGLSGLAGGLTASLGAAAVALKMAAARIGIYRARLSTELI